VLGSKNIKALAVRGTRYCEYAEPRRVTELSRDLSKRSMGPATAKYRELGTATNILTFNRFGTLPTRNFQSGTFNEASKLSPQELSAGRAKTRASCVACTIGCEHIYSIGSAGSGNGTRVEYESLFALGSLCGVSDADAVLRATRRCDEIGIDTISAGGTIAFAMECVERGLLDEPWLQFGSGEALLRAIDLIGDREGIGALLAEGSRRAAGTIGHDTIAFAPQVKGLEIPGYEPRALQTMALGFAVGARGADHNRSGAYEVDFSDKVDRRNATLASVRHAIETEDRAALMDSLILCKFLRGVFTDFYGESATMLRAVTGWDVTADELRDAARRIVATKHQFNRLAGWSPAEDTLPDRFLKTPLPTDPDAVLTGSRLEALVAEYHRQRDHERQFIIADS
jgi:aldehyde:ferredoxin oxidoreductase